MRSILILLFITGCSNECVWKELDWEKPIIENINEDECIAVLAAPGTNLSFDDEMACSEEHRCYLGTLYQLQFVKVYADTTVDNWESLPKPSIPNRSVSCNVPFTKCEEFKQFLIGDQ